MFIRLLDDNNHAMREIQPSSVYLVNHRGHHQKSMLSILAHGDSETIELISPQLYMQSQAFFGRHSVVVKTGNSVIELRVSNKDAARALVDVLKSHCRGELFLLLVLVIPTHPFLHRLPGEHLKKRVQC